MFESLIQKIKDSYYLFLAKRYVNGIKRKDDSKKISLEVVSEEVKYKILEKELITDDKDLIYSLIINLNSEDLKSAMIAKYIPNDIEIIKKLPTPLKIEVLKNKITEYKPVEIKEIIDNLNDSEFIKLIESNKNVIDEYLNKEESKFNYTFIDPDSFLETIIYERAKKIEHEELRDYFAEIIDVKALINNIDDKILGVEYSLFGMSDESEKKEYIINNFGRITSEEKKVKYLLNYPCYTSEFSSMYRTLSEESKKDVLSEIFTKQNIKKYVAEKKSNDFEKPENIGMYLKEYLGFIEIDMDADTISDLYYIVDEESDERKILVNMLEDDEKAKLILDAENYTYTYNYKSNRVIDLIFCIEDKNVLIETIHQYANDFERITDHNELYEYLISRMDEDLKVKLVQYEIDKKENTDKNLLLLTLSEINDKDGLKQILVRNLNEKYFRFDDDKNITRINSIIADKIVEYSLADELLNEADINNFSEENKFLLLLNARKETREKVLKENEDLTDIINTINQNEDIIRKISDGTSSTVGKLTFYRNLIVEIDEQNNGEKKFTLSQKLEMLEMFQKNHASIGETAMFGFLENVGELNVVEKLARYPDIQNRILKVPKEHLKVILHVYKYASENLTNADYILNEILTEYSDSTPFEIYEIIEKYISVHKDIPEDVNNKIFNIVTNSKLYNPMFMALKIEKIEDVDNFIDNIDQIENEFFDKAIRGEIEIFSNQGFSVKDLYLMKYYNLDEKEAQEKVTEYITFIEDLEETPENLVLKKYIFSLYNVLNSNDDILRIAYDLTQDAEVIDRIEIEKIECAIKEKIAEELKDSLFTIDGEKIGSADVVLEDNKEFKVDIYEAKDNFNMLVTVLDAYGGGNGVYEDYEKQWNTNEYAPNQRICTTYIGNNSLKTVKRNNCVIYGFTEFDNSALVKMAPYDIVSINDELVTRSKRDAMFIRPKELINKTRRYNELDIERTGKNGKKLQPSYIVCFAKTIDEVNEESKKAAAQFGIPIVLIDREKCAEMEFKKISEMVKKFTEELDVSLIDNIVEEFCNNKYTSDTTLRDLKEAEEQGKKDELVHIDEKYFSDERFVEILQYLIDVAKIEEKKRKHR